MDDCSEIVDLNVVNDKADAASTSSISGSKNKVENIPIAFEAFTCLDTAFRWFKAQDESYQYQITVLKKVRDLAARQRVGLLQETKVRDFFKR
ncbi:unnamed protein product [Parnassius apollo]|uniref:(apollo) hypothetical protein n=1 Tax=Parnassius apollo TaxID=110799 RepID=A0A8S3XK20_PARAO|nr:unnamed protein product [Parnassius apollo]